MNHLHRPSLCVLLVALASASGGASSARAGATVNFGSTVGAMNLTSSGKGLGGEFTFQLGTFAGGFKPSPQNTDEWLAAWRPASDATGVPLEKASVSYQVCELGEPFPAGARANSFSGAVTLQHNEPPFDLGFRLYIWGYDQRVVPGDAEWILISDPSWVWPDGVSYLPAVNYAVSAAGESVIGEINGDGFEMKTAAVRVPNSAADSFEGWQAKNFSAAALGDSDLRPHVWGESADPDGDGLTNLLEYFAGQDPNARQSERLIVVPEIREGELVAEYRRSSTARDATGSLEWSVDLRSWARVAPEYEEPAAAAGWVRVTAPTGGGARVFLRLSVRRLTP